MSVESLATFKPTRTLLCQEKAVSLLECDAVSRVLVVGRKSGGVCALRHGTIEDFAERVDALARRRVLSVHQMHVDVGVIEWSGETEQMV